MTNLDLNPLTTIKESKLSNLIKNNGISLFLIIIAKINVHIRFEKV